MLKDTEQPGSRKRPAHFPANENCNRSIIIFVTVCTNKKNKIWCTQDAHDLLLNSWRQADAWSVGRYVIMPDHIHFFCGPAQYEYPSLKKWVSYWKSIFTKSWPGGSDKQIWQRDFWDRQLRKEESYQEKWEYVRQNPVRAGLVDAAEEWPYQGEMNVLMWHD